VIVLPDKVKEIEKGKNQRKKRIRKVKGPISRKA
jgi:hypothetical protein